MNERIQKLAVEAGLEMCGCGCDMPTRQSAKFAELIVTKCAVIATRCESNGNKNIGAEILKHFGVEE